jgi:hypothetical protein
MSRYILETGMIKPPDPKESTGKKRKQKVEDDVTHQASHKIVTDPADKSDLKSAQDVPRIDEGSSKGLSSKVTSMRVCKPSLKCYVSICILSLLSLCNQFFAASRDV